MSCCIPTINGTSAARVILLSNALICLRATGEAYVILCGYIFIFRLFAMRFKLLLFIIKFRCISLHNFV